MIGVSWGGDGQCSIAYRDVNAKVGCEGGERVTKRRRHSQGRAIAEANREGANGVAATAPVLPDATRERLGELGKLEADWDSYGALPVSDRSLGAASELVGRLVARARNAGVPHEIMPIADGGVALEWRYPTIELGLNACPKGGWTALLVERSEQGRRAVERYDLSDDDALALVFDAVGPSFA
jgi:hypothetical protein